MKLSLSQRKSLQAAAEKYASNVAVAGEYLTARGLTPNVAHTFLLGVVVDPLPGDEDYVGRLSVPYLTPAGVADVRFRALTADQQPKYLSRPNAAARMFNVLALHADSPRIAVCEGEIDTIVMHSLVGIPAVGVPGASQFKDHHRLLLEDFEEVIVWCDGDTAGREFGKRVASEVDGATVVHLPDGMDVNDCYLQFGADDVRRRAGV